MDALVFGLCCATHVLLLDSHSHRSSCRFLDRLLFHAILCASCTVSRQVGCVDTSIYSGQPTHEMTTPTK